MRKFLGRIDELSYGFFYSVYGYSRTIGSKDLFEKIRKHPYSAVKSFCSRLTKQNRRLRIELTNKHKLLIGVRDVIRNRELWTIKRLGW